MTYGEIVKDLREKHEKMDTSWEFTNYYDEKGNISHVVYVYRWVDDEQVIDVEITGSSINSNDWKVVREKYTYSYMELYKPNFD